MSTQSTQIVSVLDDYQGVAHACADWSRLGPEAEVRYHREHVDAEDQLAEMLADSEVIVAMRERTPLRAGLLRRLPNLRLVITTGMGNNSIDRIPGITYCGTRALVSPTVELTWALLLAARRSLIGQSAALRDGAWQTAVGDGLEGTTLGLVGLGRIGARVARIATAFDMKVLAWSQNLTEERCRESGAEHAGSLAELCTRADTVSVHLRLSDRTRGLLGVSELAAIGPTGLLVNTSRAEIVDQPALVTALHDGSLGGAALDVYDREPLPADHPLLSAPNTTLTPHLGYVVRPNYELFFGDAVEDILAFRGGTPIRVLADN